VVLAECIERVTGELRIGWQVLTAVDFCMCFYDGFAFYAYRVMLLMSVLLKRVHEL
jgi:hypothetical protein